MSRRVRAGFGGLTIALSSIVLYNIFTMKINLTPGIAVDENVRFGKPIIAGTRVPVDMIVGKIAGGMDIPAVAKEYDLTKIQILAALRYAADVVANEDVAIA